MAKRKAKGRKKRKAGDSLLQRIRRFFTVFAFGGEVDEDTSSHLQEIKGLALIGFSLWLAVSLWSYHVPYSADAGANWSGKAGFYLAGWVYLGIGWAGYLVCFLCLTWGAVLVGRKRVGLPTLRVFGGLCFLVSTGLLFELALGERYPPSSQLPYGPGGWLAGQLVGEAGATFDRPALLIDKFGGPGLWILLVLSTVISFMLATEMAFYPAIQALREWVEESREKRGESLLQAVGGWLKRLFAGLWEFLRGEDLDAQPALGTKEIVPKPRRSRAKRSKKNDPTGELFEEPELDDEEEEEEWEEEPVDEDEEWEEDDEDEYEDEEDEDEEGEEWEEYDEEEEDEEEPEPVVVQAKKKPMAAPKATPVVFDPPSPPPGPWKFPPIDLLEPPRAGTLENDKAVEAQALRLENALKSFRVEASVVGAKVGPAVTLFELEVAQGTRMNKVTQLSQEIAAALRAKSVRIIAPIPGKATIGIEVPNEKRRVVRLSELVSQKAYDKKFMALPLFLGMDAEGNAIVEDLARMPHLLIAGTTGSGKSVCINTILASLLLTRSPHDVQLILVDPKMVELQMFSKVPHLMLPVVSDMRQATNVILWAVEKMEGRYELFKDAGVRHIKGYNELGEDGLRERLGDDFNEERTPRHVPYIVIVIDEMADLMMTSKKEAEQSITRLAQKSRAVGIHVIVATQRPSTDVITGVLKGNLPTRIAFQVASKVDSRVILDTMGAEKLLGQGDMLYTPPQSSQLRRVQGALVEDHEIQGVVDFVSLESAPNFSQELVQSATGAAQPGQSSGASEDDLWDEAVRVILKSRRGSASLLQRALGIGYTRASRLIDLMTSEGIVGEHKGSKAREVLMSLEDWEEMHGTPLGQAAEDE